MRRRLTVDDRAIEGLPVRLVIALVVGVAALSVMMGMIDDLDGIGAAEVDADPDPRVIATGGETVTFTVVGPDGEPVEDATVVVTGDTAQLTGPMSVKETTGEDGTVTMSLDAELGPNQARGELEVTVVPPSEGEYVDERTNTDVTVVDELR